MSIPIALGIGHGTVGRSAEREIRVGWGCVGHYAGASARLCNFGAMRPGGSPTEAGTRSWPGWHRGSRGMRPKQEAPKSDQAGTLPSEWPEPYQSHMKRRGPSCGFVELGDIAPLRPSARAPQLELRPRQHRIALSPRQRPGHRRPFRLNAGASWPRAGSGLRPCAQPRDKPGPTPEDLTSGDYKGGALQQRGLYMDLLLKLPVSMPILL